MSQSSLHAIEDWRVHAPYEFPVYTCVNDLSNLGCHAHLWHWHHEMQFCVVLEGCVKFLTQDSAYASKKQQGIFINSDCVHRCQNLSTPCCKYICINFDPKLLQLFPGSSVGSYINQFLSAHLMECVPLSPDSPWQAKVMEDIREIHRLHSEKNLGYEMLVCARLFTAFGMMFQQMPELFYSAPVNRSGHEAALRTILAYIEKHFTEKITLSEIASAAHLSESECCRLFKRSLNRTIFDYILDLRIRFSANLLEHSNDSISGIAYRSGFAGTSYFIKQFRARLGCTPKQYRDEKR